MKQFDRQVCRILHEEHEAVLALLGRVEQVFAHAAAAWPPQRVEADLARLLGDLKHGLSHEVTRHFALEEEQLFPLLRKAGEGDLVELLLEEHAAVRDVAVALLPLLPRALAGELSPPQWDALRRHALELAERLGAHARKEELSLVPILDETLDEDRDREIALHYAAT